MYSSHPYRGDQPQAGFNLGDAVLGLTRSPILSTKSSNNITAVTSSPLQLQFGGLVHAGMASLDMAASSVGAEVDMGKFSFPRGQIENWGDSGVVVTSSRSTDASTDADTDDRNKAPIGAGQQGAIVSLDSSYASKGKTGDQKGLRRLAQNREAARKSRLRKKAYVQQLEISRLKLIQLEQELQRAQQQGIFIAGGLFGDHSYSTGGNGAMAFDMEYARWLDEHQRLINDLRSALNARVVDNELQLHVDALMTHYDEFFRLKSIGTKSDVFHMLSGMWTTPAERCFMWLGGFRSSELLKILASHLEPLTDQQLMGICNLQQSSQQAEDALSQGMEALQQSLSDTLASASLGASGGTDDVACYMGQMAIAMGKLGTLESFLRQADLLRQQTLRQMHRILTTSQAAHALLAISDYFSRLRALSSLWLARPRGS
uniref:Transcription factor TGA2 isoform X2 n=1 Tax=Elaeis guineensis var. tenera TaxID=51953 RepID=A0A6I9RU49_ELAGV|nr:transcription factor TGA2 isoform X2 [Elaeis guineensis]